MSWQKLTAIWGGIVTVAGALSYLVTTAFQTYTMVIDIHSQYATKVELSETYLRTRVDDYLEKKRALEDLVSFYETKLNFEGELSESERGRLAKHSENLKKLVADFKLSIEEL